MCARPATLSSATAIAAKKTQPPKPKKGSEIKKEQDAQNADMQNLTLLTPLYIFSVYVITKL